MSVTNIDDNDARFTYTGLWDTLRGSSEQWASTVHSTWDYNATASLSFNGTWVKVYGTVPVGGGTVVTDFSLDSGTAVRVWRDSGSIPLYNQTFFDSGTLPFGQHSIAISNKGEDNDRDFRLDRVEIGTASSSSSLSTISTTTTGSASTSASLEATSSSEPTATRGSTPIAAIVGAILGSIILIFVLFLGWFLVRRRRNEVHSPIPADVKEKRGRTVRLWARARKVKSPGLTPFPRPHSSRGSDDSHMEPSPVLYNRSAKAAPAAFSWASASLRPLVSPLSEPDSLGVHKSSSPSPHRQLTVICPDPSEASNYSGAEEFRPNPSTNIPSAATTGRHPSPSLVQGDPPGTQYSPPTQLSGVPDEPPPPSYQRVGSRTSSSHTHSLPP